LKKQVPGIVRFLLLAVVLASGVFLYARFVEPARLEVTSHCVESSRIPGSSDGLRMVQISDLHLSRYYDTTRLKRVVEQVNRLEPSVLLCTGDIFDDYPTYSDHASELLAVLQKLQAPHRFAVLGNHDYSKNTQDAVIAFLEAAGFTVLNNECVQLETLGITITGIADCMFGGGRIDVLDDLQEDGFQLVLCHEPDLFAEIGALPVDLMLSGHTHGGQIRIGSYAPMLPRMGKLYLAGMYRADNARGSKLYVNRGLGTSQLPLRFMAVPEITLITLHRVEF